MKRTFIMMGILCLAYLYGTAQDVSEVLKNSIPVERNHRIFFQYDMENKALKVDVTKKMDEVDFTSFQDSVIFSIRKGAVNVYARPLNPLSYSFSSKSEKIIDPINKAASEAFLRIIEGIRTGAGDDKILEKSFGIKTDAPCEDKLKVFSNLKNTIKDTLKLKEMDKVILKIFTKLKDISFYDEESTISSLDEILSEIEGIEKKYKNITDSIQALNELEDCEDALGLFTSFMLQPLVVNLNLSWEEQKKKLANLRKLYQSVRDMQEKASKGGGTSELKWCIPMGEITVRDGMMSTFSISVQESGYNISEDQEIVATEVKQLVNQSILIREFQRFVPEVSVGTAFTFLEYNTYGTTSDSTGQQLVAAPQENTIRNLNVTTMINFNYFIQNSAIHPFYQLGIGINSGMPTFLTGLGIRSSVDGVNRLAVSGGLAMTWLQELDELEVGDKVSGTANIDKDFKFSSSPSFTPYIGLQYNF